MCCAWPGDTRDIRPPLVAPLEGHAGGVHACRRAPPTKSLRVSQNGTSRERTIGILDDQGWAGGGIRRAVLQRVRRGLEALESGKEPTDSVHEARKRIKEQRAALLLGRDAMGERAYRRDDRVLKKAARSLGNARDAHVVSETLETILDSIPALDPAVAESARGRAWAEFTTVAEAPGERASQTLEGLADRVLGWRLDDVDESVLTRALRRSWRKARRGFKKALREPAATQLHRWRRRVKVLYHQSGFVEGLFPELDGRRDDLHELGHRLGALNDLTILRRALTREPAEGPPPLPVLAAIEARERILRDEVLARGSELFARRARSVVTRAGKPKQVNRQESPAPSPAAPRLAEPILR